MFRTPRPFNFGCEPAPPKFGGFGLTGIITRNLMLWLCNDFCSLSAAQYQPKGRPRTICPSFCSFQWRVCSNILFSSTSVLTNSLLFWGRFNIQRFSNTSFGQTLLRSGFGGLLLKQTFCWNVAAFPHNQECLAIGPRNPCTTPTKSTINIASAKLGGGAYFAFCLGSNNSHTTPPKIPLDEEGLLWGWCVVGGPLLPVL